MQLLIHPSSMTPLYEQISDQIRSQIQKGLLKSGELLPSVRSCAREYKISALTVKKAYDLLEKEGLVHTVQGKGTFVAEISPQILAEENQKRIEELFQTAIDKARTSGMDAQAIHELIDLLMED